MVKFIHRDYGSEMWVAEERVEEYKAAGHELAAKLEAGKTTDKPKKKTVAKKK